jgi:hypothetical protein
MTRARIAILGAVTATVVLVAWFLVNRLALVDSEERIWPDELAREYSRLGVLRRAALGFSDTYGMLPGSIRELITTRPDLARRVKPPWIDVWGDSVSYVHEGPFFTLRSAGPDRRLGTDDDLVEATATTYEGKRALRDTTGRDSLRILRGVPPD